MGIFWPLVGCPFSISSSECSFDCLSSPSSNMEFPASYGRKPAMEVLGRCVVCVCAVCPLCYALASMVGWATETERGTGKATLAAVGESMKHNNSYAARTRSWPMGEMLLVLVDLAWSCPCPLPVAPCPSLHVFLLSLDRRYCSEARGGQDARQAIGAGGPCGNSPVPVGVVYRER